MARGMTLSAWTASLFLGLCLLLGGSAQGLWSNLILQLLAIGILIVLLATPPKASASKAGRSLEWIAGLFILVSVLQLVPVPPSIWAGLPGRQFVVDGFRLADMPLPWLPITLTPNATISALLAVLPPAAIYALVRRSTDVRPAAMLTALFAVTVVAVLIGVLQKAGSGDLYFYPISNVGASTGFFANSNHMGALLLVAIPFVAAVGASTAQSLTHKNERAFGVLILLLLVVTLIVGIITNGSLAVILLGAPVVAASLLLLVPPGRARLGRLIAGFAVVSAMAVFAFLQANSAILGGQQTSISTRQEMWAHTARLAWDFFPFGSGLGSFPSIYPLSEDLGRVDWTFINHAHNDYLELLLETGIPGLVLVLAFLLWWAWQTAQIWISREVSLLARAATIASGALLLHSIVDYPMRTAALSSLFGWCLAIMVTRPRTLTSPPKSDARHLTFEDLK